jgi:hypothetical protein
MMESTVAEQRETPAALLFGAGKEADKEAPEATAERELGPHLRSNLGILARLPETLRNNAVGAIIAAVFVLLDYNMIELLVDGWREHRDLTDAARHTLAKPGSTELVALATHSITVTQKPSIDLLLNGEPVASRRSRPRAAPRGHRVNLSTCHIRGRLLVLKRANGQTGAGLYVPRRGLTITNDALYTTGEYVLSATNTKGWLMIKWSVPSHRHLMVPADSACNENYVNLEGATWETLSGTPGPRWYYKENSVPSYLTESATEADIRQGSQNMVQGLNNCGYSTGIFNVVAPFKGSTTNSANIKPDGTCTDKFPDGQNTVEWIAFDSNHPNLLGSTCWGSSNFPNGTRNIIEADIAAGNNRGIVDNLPANCVNKQDLQTLMTHEWGHALGLAHEFSGPDEVMYPTRDACTLRRKLGKGDYGGMSGMY